MRCSNARTWCWRPVKWKGRCAMWWASAWTAPACVGSSPTPTACCNSAAWRSMATGTISSPGPCEKTRPNYGVGRKCRSAAKSQRPLRMRHDGKPNAPKGIPKQEPECEVLKSVHAAFNRWNSSTSRTEVHHDRGLSYCAGRPWPPPAGSGEVAHRQQRAISRR